MSQSRELMHDRRYDTLVSYFIMISGAVNGDAIWDASCLRGWFWVDLFPETHTAAGNISHTVSVKEMRRRFSLRIRFTERELRRGF